MLLHRSFTARCLLQQQSLFCRSLFNNSSKRGCGPSQHNGVKPQVGEMKDTTRIEAIIATIQNFSNFMTILAGETLATFSVQASARVAGQGQSMPGNQAV